LAWLSGLSAGCEGYCKKHVDESRVASLRLDACTFLRGTPPIDRMRACQSGFSAAVARAKFAAVYEEKPPNAAAELDSVDLNTEAQQEAAAAQANRKLNVKKIPEVRVRGLAL
jgi:hypothetical protein